MQYTFDVQIVKSRSLRPLGAFARRKEAKMSDVIGRVWPEWRVEDLLGRGSYGKVYRAVRSSHGSIGESA
jgi:hypothetical protein